MAILDYAIGNLKGRVRTKVVDLVLTNTIIPVDDPDLRLILSPGEVWLTAAILFYDGPVGADLRLTWSLPAGAAGWHTGSTDWLARTLGAGNYLFGTGGVGTFLGGIYLAILTNGLTGGAATLQAAQGAADAAPTTLLAASSLLAVRLT